MNCRQILYEASKKLKNKNFKSPQLDTELLLAKTLNLGRNEILLNLNHEIDNDKLDKFNYYLNLRKNYKSVAHILNEKFFWKDSFFVNEDVFVPRPETELIIEKMCWKSVVIAKNH